MKELTLLQTYLLQNGLQMPSNTAHGVFALTAFALRGSGGSLVTQIEGTVLNLGQHLEWSAAGGGVGLGAGHHSVEEEVGRLQLSLVELSVLCCV